MHMKKISTFAALLLADSNGFSCLWITGTKFNATSISVGGYP